MNHESSTMIGQTIGRYEILEKLGEGGMGVVYKARDAKLERTVALKFLPERVAATATERQRFLQEARAAAAVTHPNICTVHDIAEHDGRIFIVMEFVDGKPLREVINAGPKLIPQFDGTKAASLILNLAGSRGMNYGDVVSIELTPTPAPA